MAGCEFDKLFASSVPHVYEKIFFSLDYNSFKECLKVCRYWKDLLTSQSYRRIGKLVFCRAIHEELRIAIEEGLIQVVKRILSNGMVDIDYITEWVGTPLYLASRLGQSVIVQLLQQKFQRILKLNTKSRLLLGSNKTNIDFHLMLI